MSAEKHSKGQALGELARRSGTPMAQDAALTELLTEVAAADAVPKRLLQVLAHTLAFVDDLEKSE